MESAVCKCIWWKDRLVYLMDDEYWATSDERQWMCIVQYISRKWMMSGRPAYNIDMSPSMNAHHNKFSALLLLLAKYLGNFTLGCMNSLYTIYLCRHNKSAHWWNLVQIGLCDRVIFYGLSSLHNDDSRCHCIHVIIVVSSCSFPNRAERESVVGLICVRFQLDHNGNGLASH